MRVPTAGFWTRAQPGLQQQPICITHLGYRWERGDSSQSVPPAKPHWKPQQTAEEKVFA